MAMPRPAFRHTRPIAQKAHVAVICSGPVVGRPRRNEDSPPAAVQWPHMTEPDWLTWTRELQAIAQAGLTFCENPYDRKRYEQMRALASRMMAAHTAAPAERIEALFAAERGYPTPKVDVRGATFDDRHRVLMVRETSDAGRRTLPGGWADVNLTPAESVVKEVREEAGYHVRVRKLAAAWDRTRQGHGPSVFSCVKLFYVCDLVGGEA